MSVKCQADPSLTEMSLQYVPRRREDKQMTQTEIRQIAAADLGGSKMIPAIPGASPLVPLSTRNTEMSERFAARWLPTNAGRSTPLHGCQEHSTAPHSIATSTLTQTPASDQTTTRARQ